MKLPEFLNFGWGKKEQDPSASSDANPVINLDDQKKKAHDVLIQGVTLEAPGAVVPATSQEVQVTQPGRSGLPAFKYELPEREKPVTEQNSEGSSDPGIIDRVAAPLKEVVGAGAEELTHAGRDLTGAEKHDIGYKYFLGTNAFRLVGNKVSQVVNKLKRK